MAKVGTCNSLHALHADILHLMEQSSLLGRFPLEKSLKSK